jgi:hypothetical protein
LLSYSGALHAKSLSKIPDPISNMLIMMKVKHFAGNKSPILSRIGEPTKKLSGRHGCHSVLLLYRPKSYLNLGDPKTKNIRLVIRFWAHKHVTEVARS